MKSAERKEARDPGGADSCRIHILLVEDDRNISRIAKHALSRAGYRIETAESASEGLDAFKARRPDLVLMDVMLPDGTGFELCRLLREDLGADTPILFMSVRQDLQTRLESFREGGTDFIPKPFFIEELVQRIRLRLSQKRDRDEASRRNEALELRDQSRKDMLEAVTHDLKQPLTSIQGIIQLIEEQHIVSDAECRKLLGSCRKAAGNMVMMIHDLLDVGRAELGELSVRSWLTRPRDILRDVRELFDVQCAHRGIRLETEVRPEDLELRTDPRLLYRILCNLASNAVKFSSRGRQVEIGCAEHDGKVRFTVTDHGYGIPDREKERIFGRYVRSHVFIPQIEKGFGIGLFFCRVAADTLRGKLWCEDIPGGGSRFILELPADGGKSNGNE